MASEVPDYPLLTRQRLMLAVVLLACAITVMTCSACFARRAEVALPTTHPYGVAQLLVTVDGELNSTCTVWKIKRGMAITAGHCCPSVEEILEEREDNRQLQNLMRILGGEEPEEDQDEDQEQAPPVIEITAIGRMAVTGVKFEVLRDDDMNDVCVLRGAMKGSPIILAKKEPNIGERVWTEGYPRGVFLISEGYWSGARDMDTTVASTAIWGGASGSPVMNAEGEAVALLNRYYPPMSNMTLMVPLEWLHANVTSASRLLSE